MVGELGQDWTPLSQLVILQEQSEVVLELHTFPEMLAVAAVVQQSKPRKQLQRLLEVLRRVAMALEARQPSAVTELAEVEEPRPSGQPANLGARALVVAWAAPNWSPSGSKLTVLAGDWCLCCVASELKALAEVVPAKWHPLVVVLRAGPQCAP